MREQRFQFDSRKVIGSGAALLAILGLIALILWQWQRHLFPDTSRQRVPEESSPRAAVEFESGKLQRDFKAQQEKILRSYEWLDRDKHWARIPLTRAMEITSGGGK